MSENILTGKNMELDEKTLEKIKAEVSDGKVDYKMLIDMVKEMDSQLKVLEDFANMRVRDEFHLDSSILDNILPLKEENIKVISNEDGLNYLKKYYTKDDEYKELLNLIHRYQKGDNDSELLTEEESIRKILLEIKKDSMTIYQVRQQINELKNESADILKEYNTYLSSSEVRKKKMERLEKMKEMSEKETDENKKKEMMKKISIMESSYSLSFLFDRIDKYGKKEIESIKNAFFDKARGSYIIKRYKDKIKLFGFNQKTYRYFFNIEENFLPESYHVFNNLFLFIYMRTVAYYDPYNKEEKMYAQALTSTLANLIYHRFDETEREKEFIEIIEKILDKFEEYRDYFKEYNRTQPGHPMRIEASKKHETERRKLLIENMDKMGITGYPEDGTADELQDYFNDAVEKLVKEQTKETDEDQVSVEENKETGEVSVTPTMKKTADVSDEVSEVVQNVSGVRVRCATTEEEFEKFKSGEGYQVGDIVVVYPNTKKDDDNDDKDESESNGILYCFDGEKWNKIDAVESEIDTDGNLTDKVKSDDSSDDSMVVDIKRRN